MSLLIQGPGIHNTVPAGGGGSTAPSIVETDVVQINGSSGSFTPGSSNTNDMILAFSSWHTTSSNTTDSMTATFGGVSMTSHGKRQSGSTDFDAGYWFSLPRASWAGTGSQTVAITVDAGTPSIGITIFTVQDAHQSATVTQAGAQGTSASLSITPTAADSLVLGGMASSTSQNVSFSVGVTETTPDNFRIGGTAAHAVGDAVQGASALTVTINTVTGRGLLNVIAIEPA